MPPPAVFPRRWPGCLSMSRRSPVSPMYTPLAGSGRQPVSSSASPWSILLVVVLLVAGVVADRLARKVVMIASDIARLAAQATMAALLIGGAAKLWQLVSLVFLYGLGDAFFRPTSTGFVPETVSRARL